MGLYPIYWHLIATGRKGIEGRAWKPDSSRQYHSIKTGDQITFHIDTRNPSWKVGCKKYRIDPEAKMRATVLWVHYGPLVQWCFHSLTEGDAGESFQPDSSYHYDPVYRALSNAAHYYEIPNYTGLIAKNGFLGIKLHDIKIVNN